MFNQNLKRCTYCRYALLYVVKHVCATASFASAILKLFACKNENSFNEFAEISPVNLIENLYKIRAALSMNAIKHEISMRIVDSKCYLKKASINSFSETFVSNICDGK